MKTLNSRTFALVLAALALPACGGAGPEESTGQSGQDLSVLGITIPQPTIGVSVGDAGVTVNPVQTIGELLPPQGIKVDPIGTVNAITGALSQPITIGLNAPGIKIGVTGGLELPQLPNPFGDGGITIISP